MFVPFIVIFELPIGCHGGFEGIEVGFPVKRGSEGLLENFLTFVSITVYDENLL